MPLQAHQDDEDDEEFWRNRIIYVMIRDSNHYHVEQTTILLIKSLATRNGIMEILKPQSTLFHENTNNYLLKAMKESYREHNEKELQKFKTKFQKLIDFTQKNSNRSIGLVEEIMLKTYWSILST